MNTSDTTKEAHLFYGFSQLSELFQKMLRSDENLFQLDSTNEPDLDDINSLLKIELVENSRGYVEGPVEMDNVPPYYGIRIIGERKVAMLHKPTLFERITFSKDWRKHITYEVSQVVHDVCFPSIKYAIFCDRVLTIICKGDIVYTVKLIS